MSGGNFSLQPFSPLPPDLAVKITGRIIRRPRQLALCFDLRGDLPALVIPAPARPPARRPGLWEATCFEFFLGVQQAPQYWEFNLSPAGHWNVYRFAGYRQGMAEETALRSLPMNVQHGPDSLRLRLDLEVDGIVPGGDPLEVGIAAVIQLAGGGLTYWALTHPGPEPDFHRRDSFVVEL